MAVKDAIQDEFNSFIEEEINEQASTLKDAYTNTSKSKWYKRQDGPQTKHEFKRDTLNEEVKRSPGGPSRGIGKIAADLIAVRERTYNLVYNSTRLGMFVKAHVRAEETEAVLENIKEEVLEQVTV